MLPSPPLCVALDAPDLEACMSLAEATEDHAGAFKVGLTAFASAGPELVTSLASRRPVFVDSKLHDIPAQVEGAVRSVRALGASFVTVHASGGPDMISAAVGAAGEELSVLGVTVLTSLDDASLNALGFSGGVSSQVLRLAEVALDAGATGLVCSPREVASIRDRFGARSHGGPLLFVPGIREANSPADDQRRTGSVREALEAGADVLVVGRPITAAPDPGEAARRLLAGVESLLSG